MRLHQLKNNNRFNRFIVTGIFAASLLAASLLVITDSAPQPVLAIAEETVFVSDQGETRQGEVELEEDTPVTGQIFTSGNDFGVSQLTRNTGQLGNTGHALDLDLKFGLHSVDDRGELRCREPPGLQRWRRGNRLQADRQRAHEPGHVPWVDNRQLTVHRIIVHRR